MSITNDIRSYADNAVHQGKQALNTAQTQLNDVSEQATKYTTTARDNVYDAASDIAGKATEAVTDLRASAEKAVNLDAVKSAIEPYVTQAKEYGRSVTDRAEGLISDLKDDKRVAKILDSATSVSEVVIDTVQQRVVRPVRSLTGLGGKPATSNKPTAANKPSPTKAAKQATTRPSTKRSDKPAAKPTARKAPAKRASSTTSKASTTTKASTSNA